jgi:hypothetical protein
MIDISNESKDLDSKEHNLMPVNQLFLHKSQTNQNDYSTDLKQKKRKDHPILAATSKTVSRKRVRKPDSEDTPQPSKKRVIESTTDSSPPATTTLLFSRRMKGNKDESEIDIGDIFMEECEFFPNYTAAGEPLSLCYFSILFNFNVKMTSSCK